MTVKQIKELISRIDDLPEDMPIDLAGPYKPLKTRVKEWNETKEKAKKEEELEKKRKAQREKCNACPWHNNGCRYEKKPPQPLQSISISCDTGAGPFAGGCYTPSC